MEFLFPIGRLKKMLVSTNQPYFAPYPGFFYKAYLSDIFVILDNVQHPRKTTWINRNRFKNDQGALWMTVPVRKKGLGLQKISAVRICHDGKWNVKFMRSFKSAYANAPFFPEHLAFLQRIISSTFERVLELNMEIIRYVMSYLKIETKIVMMSDLATSGKGSPLIFDICKSLDATRFLVQASALKYYDVDLFMNAGLRLTSFKKPEYVYPQMWGDFIENLSILDMIFNCGPKTRDILVG